MGRNPVGIVRHCLKNYFKFDGRASQKEYWIFTAFCLIIVEGVMWFGDTFHAQYLLAIPVWGLIIPQRAVAVRRAHDCGFSGWILLIPLVELFCALTKGEIATNRYGSSL